MLKDSREMLKLTNRYQIMNTNRNTPKIRILIFLMGIFTFFSVTVATIWLYSHYGPLTPFGNRYYHSFDLRTIPWRLVIIEMVAIGSLIYPSIRFGMSSNSELHHMGIFPSKNKIEGIGSLILTALSFGTQILYSLGFMYIVNEYVSNHSRIMAEDLETGIQYLAYIGCILFWCIVNLIYTFKYRFRW